MTEEQYQNILSEIRVLYSKIQFIESDIAEIRDTHLDQIRQCVETVAKAQLENVQTTAAKSWKVERM
jgi:prefoldin subunit 5